jgi:hypothetical protein
MFMCRRHWSKLPRNVQAAIWREYRAGQEIDKRPSLAYLAVWNFAVGYEIFRPNDEDAARTCAGYLQKALVYADQVQRNGRPDPLAGLR